MVRKWKTVGVPTRSFYMPHCMSGNRPGRKSSRRYEENGCEAYPVTLTGMGERVHLASEGYGVETVIEDVLNVIKYNDLDDVVLVGHSSRGRS